jgi:hypothetical protein
MLGIFSAIFSEAMDLWDTFLYGLGSLLSCD